jgi:hypothetical protein
MTQTTGTTLYSVNPDPADIGTGLAVTSLVLAAAARRPHLRDAITSFQYDTERGLGIRVKDAGHRQHLANALGFDALVGERFRVPAEGGFGQARSGSIEGITVYIWNLEV